MLETKSEFDQMNLSSNHSLATTDALTYLNLRKTSTRNPFDSWYIGGILFMCTVMFVLLYANYYRENTCQICWIRLLTKLGLLPPLPTSFPLHHLNDPLVI